jgi:hypothetical protein
MFTRLYFNLVSKHESLPDREGVQVVDVRHAQAAALELLHELRKEDASAAQEWSGWTLNVTDAAGRVVFSIHLTLVEDAGGPVRVIEPDEKSPRREKLARQGHFPERGGRQTRSKDPPITGRNGRKTS